MKKLVFLMFAFIIASSSQAQVSKELYNKYSDSKGVETTFISPSMFNMMESLQTDDDLSNILDSFKSFQGMYVIDCDNSATIRKIKKDIDLKLSQNELELMVENKEDDESTRIFTVKKGTELVGLIIIEEDSEYLNVVCFDGVLKKEVLEKVFGEILFL